jgi:hypothetical protein
MATDYWSKEEGAIFDACSYILPCSAAGAITLGAAITSTTTQTDGAIEVTAATGLGDGFAVACKAATADGDVIPVLFYGVYKMAQSGTGNDILMGEFVMNSITTTVASVSDVGTYTIANLKVVKGSSYILGMALQKSAAAADDILILVGKCA